MILPNGKRFASVSESGIVFPGRGSKGISDDGLRNLLIEVGETVKSARNKTSVIRQEQQDE